MSAVAVMPELNRPAHLKAMLCIVLRCNWSDVLLVETSIAAQCTTLTLPSHSLRKDCGPNNARSHTYPMVG
eukprot:scaffold211113_cov31-Prasinocladus_malaysianus.AAC.1